jgi:Holliday junction resolvase RusA-like endonuclease
MTRISFHVAGIPQPQGSTRGFVVNGRPVITSANKSLRPWRDSLMVAAAEARGDIGPITDPVWVDVAFAFARPAGHFGKKGVLPSAPPYPAVRPDIDKLCRAVLDALTESGCIRDDGQVVELTASKNYGKHPGVFVSVMSEPKE